MKKILLDSNFLISCFKFKVDLNQIENLLVEPFQLFTLASIVNELKTLAGSKSKDSKYARLALKFLDSKKIKILKTNRPADEAILELADKNTLVATNDLSLRKKLKVKGIKTIYLRGRKRLEVS